MIARLLKSQFDECSDHCGWIAAIVAALAYGTFGVPIKQTVSIDVHPLVLQSYKTFVMFLFSWLIIYMGEPVRFTPWGLLSGLLWVCGGTGGIYGIRNAGMAVATGTWSSCMILINFLVGIIVFREPVASVASTFGAFVCLGIGLVGMSIYSAPSTSSSSQQQQQSSPTSLLEMQHNSPLMSNEERIDPEQQLSPTSAASPLSSGPVHVTSSSSSSAREAITSRVGPTRSRTNEGMDAMMRADHRRNNSNNSGAGYDPLRDPSVGPSSPSPHPTMIDDSRRERDKKDRVISSLQDDNAIHIPGLTKRQLGILGAVTNGVLTGSSLVPIHYAKRQGIAGAAYMLSFATGALLANVTIWAIWFMTRVISQHRESNQDIFNFTRAYESMPKWHFRQLWAPGFAAGTLLAIAMFGSILSVTYLGQGVGNSIIQSKILVSGLWGIFWYKEIVGTEAIAKWFASAAVAVISILWLSYERIHSKTLDDAHL